MIPEVMKLLVTDVILENEWHPVATSDELGEAPLGVSLLDERIVVWRAKEKIAAFRDLCIHRGTALSLGWIEDDNLVCAIMAGPTPGRRLRADSLVAGRTRDSCQSARYAVFKVRERYGLVWVCLAEPKAPIPEIAELEDPNYHTFFDFAEACETSVARMIEKLYRDFHFLTFIRISMLLEMICNS